MSCVLSTVELLMFRVHGQLEHNLQSPEERAYTRESRPHCPVGKSVGDCFDYIHSGGKATHCGWYHSLGFRPGLCKCRKGITYK